MSLALIRTVAQAGARPHDRPKQSSKSDEKADRSSDAQLDNPEPVSDGHVPSFGVKDTVTTVGSPPKKNSLASVGQQEIFILETILKGIGPILLKCAGSVQKFGHGKYV